MYCTYLSFTYLYCYYPFQISGAHQYCYDPPHPNSPRAPDPKKRAKMKMSTVPVHVHTTDITSPPFLRTLLYQRSSQQQCGNLRDNVTTPWNSSPPLCISCFPPSLDCAKQKNGLTLRPCCPYQYGWKFCRTPQEDVNDPKHADLLFFASKPCVEFVTHLFNPCSRTSFRQGI